MTEKEEDTDEELYYLNLAEKDKDNKIKIEEVINNLTITDVMKDFENKHKIKQIILIGKDGVTRNIELTFLEDDETSGGEE
jgi:hypothetical protein